MAWAAASRAGLTRAEGKGAGWPALGGRRQGAGWIWPEGGRADLAGDGARTGGGVLGRWRRRIGQGSGGVRETGGFGTDSFFLFYEFEEMIQGEDGQLHGWVPHVRAGGTVKI